MADIVSEAIADYKTVVRELNLEPVQVAALNEAVLRIAKAAIRQSTTDAMDVMRSTLMGWVGQR